MKFVVSACLLGKNCKYNGGHNEHNQLKQFLSDKEYLAVCPEMLGGLPSPRPRCEIKDGKVFDEFKKDVSDQFEKGARYALEKARMFSADIVILQPRSPSCGLHYIYDGDFQNVLIKGNGIFAQKLLDDGLQAFNVDDFYQNQEEIMKKCKCLHISL